MSSLWNGMFSPRLRKSIGTVTFVPLTRMSVRDWQWLDYANLREAAQNRIAEVMVKGDLIGFFRVMITEKAVGKSEYLWPADNRMVREYGFVEEGGRNPAAVPNKPASEFFKPTANQPFAPTAGRVDSVLGRVETLPKTNRLGISRLAVLGAPFIYSYNNSSDAREEIEQFHQDFQQQIDGIDESLADMLNFILTAFLFSLFSELGQEALNTAITELVFAESTEDVEDWVERWSNKLGVILPLAS